MIQTDELEQCVSRLLTASGFDATGMLLLPCAKGGNNRTFRLETATHTFALKEYFRQPADKRDRLASEFSFLLYANQVAPGMVPRVYGQDQTAGLALYEFIEGKPLQLADIGVDEVRAAADFFCSLNQADLVIHASGLPLASEACFSIDEHMQLIGARIASLQQITPDDAEDALAVEQIQLLSQQWDIVANDLLKTAATNGLDLTKPLKQQQRCISPSDFGFHNALRKTDGRLCFLDFEYAGWDDPGKMVGDFFAQLAVPVPHCYFDQFNEVVMQPFPAAGELVLRAKLMRAMYQIKWCCIALNVFIPVNLARRKFANPELNIIELKTAQLLKAESLLQNVGECHV